MALQGTDDPLGGVISLGSVVADKYRVDRVIGTGGMGVVVQAWHLQFDEAVAIKFLLPQRGVDPESLGRFEREARAAFKIKSEHVARVIDVGRVSDTVPYMVMEYLEGTDLGEMLTDRTALPIDAAVEYVLQACEAVAEAHALGIVHRDLKPENLFLTRRADGSPCIKVLDFGLSKVHGGAKQRERALTSAAQVMGTPQYMSPEQWMGLADVGPGCDQWAMAVILFELLTGAQPFAQEQLAQLCTQVLNGEPEPIARLRPDAPAGLEHVILRALRKRPEDRYANIAEFAYDLHHYGPLRAKASARRIAGVFRQAGVEAPEVPESRRGGLGFGMVLGGAPGPTQASGPAPPPSGAAVGRPAGSQPGAIVGQGVPSQPGPPTSAPWPSQPQPHLPPPVPAAPPSSVSGPHPQLGESGRYPQVAGSGGYPQVAGSGGYPQVAGSGGYPQLGDSGRWAPVVEPAPATVPMARNVTGQTWQSALDPQAPPDRSKLVWVAVAAIVVCVAVALGLLLSGGPGSAPVEAAGGSASTRHGDEGDAAGGQGRDRDGGLVDGGVDAGAVASQKATGGTPRLPLPRRTGPAPATTSKPAPRPGMFDHR